MCSSDLGIATLPFFPYNGRFEYPGVRCNPYVVNFGAIGESRESMAGSDPLIIRVKSAKRVNDGDWIRFGNCSGSHQIFDGRVIISGVEISC